MLKTQQRYKSAQGIAYTRSGITRNANDPAIVLIHGVGLRAEAWFYQVEALAKSHTVYAIDMPGHGESDLLIDENAGLNEYVSAIASWVETEINAPVIIMGHSMGAMIALRFAIDYPQQCTAVVALNAVYQRTEEARAAVQQRAQHMLDNPDLDRVSTPIARWFGESPNGHDLEMAKLCASWLNAAPAQGYAKAYGIFSCNDGPLASELATINVPVAFVTGDGDSNSSPEMSIEMAELTPQGFACVIEDSRHMVQITHAQAVNQQLVDFVSQLPCDNKNKGV
jgi:pimeloyl-ACP methyl ester carboxylesterase